MKGKRINDDEPLNDGQTNADVYPANYFKRDDQRRRMFIMLKPTTKDQVNVTKSISAWLSLSLFLRGRNSVDVEISYNVCPLVCIRIVFPVLGHSSPQLKLLG